MKTQKILVVGIVIGLLIAGGLGGAFLLGQQSGQGADATNPTQPAEASPPIDDGQQRLAKEARQALGNLDLFFSYCRAKYSAWVSNAALGTDMDGLGKIAAECREDREFGESGVEALLPKLSGPLKVSTVEAFAYWKSSYSELLPRGESSKLYRIRTDRIAARLEELITSAQAYIPAE